MTSADFWGRRDGTRVDNELIDLAIFVEVHLIDRLKLLALNRFSQVILGSGTRNSIAKQDLIEIVRTDKNRRPLHAALWRISVPR
jgi:hypothetical protein